MSQQCLTASPEKMKQQIARRESRSASARSSPGGLHPLLQLQRTIGNHAVGRLLRAKLAVSHPGDPYEQEADRVEGQVHRMSASESTATAQRQLMPEGEEAGAPLQTKPLAVSARPLAERQAMREEEKKAEPTVQMRRLAETSISLALRQMIPEEEKKEEAVDAGPNIEQQLGQSSDTGSLLPASMRSYMATWFGRGFSAVRVHTGSESQTLHRSSQAQAFTVGRDTYYGASKSPTDVRLTAHELTHLVPQTGGGTTQRKLVRGDADMFRRRGEDNSSRAEQELLAHELTPVVQQDGEQLQRARTQAKEGAATGSKNRLLAHELSHVFQQTPLGRHSSRLQRTPTQPQGNPQTQKLINCGPAETKTLGDDLNNAVKLAQNALDAIAASAFSPLKKQALVRHFGQTAEDQKAAIITRYTNIANSLTQKEITCASSCEHRNGLDTLCAIGYENTNTIKVCPDYWTEGFCKTYSTLLHEAVHNDGGLLDVKMTDPGYPPVNSKDNAYSYEYFAVDFEKPKEEANTDFGKKPEGEIPTAEP